MRSLKKLLAAFREKLGVLSKWSRAPVAGRPGPRRLAAFAARHPEGAAFRSWQSSYRPSASFAMERYHSINAFYLVDESGNRRAVRWQAEPRTQWAAAEGGKDDALGQDLIRRAAMQPVEFELVFTFAGPGDPVDDPSALWPGNRTRVKAGSITVTAAELQGEGECNAINFDPLVLPAGMAPTATPILHARSAAYAVSLRRRAYEVATGDTP